MSVKISTDAVINSVRIKEQADAPATPASGYFQVYAKTDGKLYYKNDAGFESYVPPVMYPGLSLTPPVLGQFSWVNQESATITQVENSLVLYGPTGAANDARVLKKSIPSTPYTITMSYITDMRMLSTFVTGFFLRQSSDGKMILFGLKCNSTAYKFEVTQYASINATDGTISSNNYTLLDAVQHVRITDDGTTRKFWWSAGGLNWQEVYSQTHTTYITPDEIGFGCDCVSTVNPIYMTILNWKEE